MKAVDPQIGFNIEIKYTSTLQVIIRKPIELWVQVTDQLLTLCSRVKRHFRHGD